MSTEDKPKPAVLQPMQPGGDVSSEISEEQIRKDFIEGRAQRDAAEMYGQATTLNPKLRFR